MNDIDAIRALIEYFATDVARVCAAHIPDENCFHHADCLRVQNARAALARIERLVGAGDVLAGVAEDFFRELHAESRAVTTALAYENVRKAFDAYRAARAETRQKEGT